MKKNKKLVNIVLIIFSFVLGLFIIELALKIAKIEYPIFQTYDYHRGFSLRPKASGWWLREGKAFVEINSQGLRDKEHKKKAAKNTIRIAVLGDSFAEARSIPLNKTFWFLMQKKLNSCLNKSNQKIEVINFGVTEYSTTQELLTLRYHVWNYNPDIVLLAFFSGNDVSDNSKILTKKKYRPFFIYKNNNMILDNSFRKTKPYLILKSNLGQTAIKLSSYSRIVQVLREIYVKNYFKSQDKKKSNSLKNNKEIIHEPGIEHNHVYNPTQKVWQDAWKVTESIIKLMNTEIKNKNSKFAVITISSPAQVHPDPLFRKNFVEKAGINDLFYPDKRIKNLGQKENFLVINLAESMQNYAEKNKIFLHGFKNTKLGDGHWNIEGHKISSEIISDNLCKNLLN